MKRSILIVTLICLGLIALSQSEGRRAPKPADERAEVATDRLTERLNLNSDQKDKIYLINFDAATEINEVMKSARDGQRSREKMQVTREKLKAINQDRSTAIEAQLTDQQRDEFQEMKAEFTERRKERVQQRRDRRQERESFWQDLENDG